MKSKVLIIIGIILLLLGVSYFAGVFPFSINLDTSCTNYSRANAFRGRGELIGPKDRDGFIVSWREDGYSETISIAGKLVLYNDPIIEYPGIQKYKYEVYGHDKYTGDWDLLSSPAFTSMYLTNLNPGVITFTGSTGLSEGAEYNFPETYDFEMIGNLYDGIKAKLYIYVDWDLMNPWDDGPYWTLLQEDRAYLYESIGGLYFDTDTSGRPINTYEIGETGRIKVKTTYGGQTVGEENKPWRVIMNYPADRGGGIFKQQDFGDMVTAYFSFTVTEDMFKTTSNNEYTITLYNTILPQALIITHTIDLKAKAPGDVVFYGPQSVENGNSISVTMTAIVSSNTQLPIEYFRAGAYYGTMDSSIPTTPTSNRWIIQITDFREISESGDEYSATMLIDSSRIKSDYEGYITIWAVAYDTQGRSSLHNQKYTINIWKPASDGGGGEPPPDMIDDETGQHDDYGGHTEPWLPWDPNKGGNWDDDDKETFNLLKIIVMIIIIALSIVIAFFYPIPGGHIGKAIVIFVGIAIAVIIYYLM